MEREIYLCFITSKQGLDNEVELGANIKEVAYLSRHYRSNLIKSRSKVWEWNAMECDSRSTRRVNNDIGRSEVTIVEISLLPHNRDEIFLPLYFPRSK